MDLSKLVMYDYHYNYMLPTFPGAKLLFTDTDSLCYWIPTEKDLYQEIKGDPRFDFSNYPIDHPNYDDTNHLVPGKMKDEMEGELILEFVGLRAKMYSILNYNGKNKKTAKGVIKSVKKAQITHSDFKTSLFDRVSFVHSGTKIINKRHELFTANVSKVTLAPFNDKKWVTRDKNEFIALSHGHCLIDLHKANESEYVNYNYIQYKYE